MTSDSRNVFANLTVFPPFPSSLQKKERSKKWGAPLEPLLQTEQGPPLNPKVTARKKKKKKDNKPTAPNQNKKKYTQTKRNPRNKREREREKERREKEKAAPPSQMRANTVPKNGETGRKRGERERGEIHGIWGCECVCVCERERKRHRERERERERERNIKDCARSAWKDNRYST